MASSDGASHSKRRKRMTPPPESASHSKRRKSMTPPPEMYQKMNLVVCGSDGSVKSSISDLILGQRELMGSVLLNEVDLMVKQNSGSCYTSSMYFTKPRYKSEIEDLMETTKKETQENSGDLRVVLLGRTGVGKSATGNTILGEEVFKELFSANSVTSVCQKESAMIRWRQVTVIDTPGLFDTRISNEEIVKEIAKCITMAAPGPHVFLLLLALGRFTQEEKEAVKIIQDLFGEESRRYTMVLFTKGDDLRKMSIDDYIKDSDRSLQNLIEQCGNRYHVFNNRNTEDQTQVTDLLQKIDSMVKENGGSCYTNETFQKVEKALQENQEKILKEKYEEKEREKEELRAEARRQAEKEFCAKLEKIKYEIIALEAAAKVAANAAVTGAAAVGGAAVGAKIGAKIGLVGGVAGAVVGAAAGALIGLVVTGLR